MIVEQLIQQDVRVIQPGVLFAGCSLKTNEIRA